METILEIREIHDTDLDAEENMSGYRIITDRQSVLLAISNEQDCCEDWGYMMSNDDPREFIGAGLLSIEKVDRNGCICPALKAKFPDVIDDSDDECDDRGTATVFININTSVGTLQFVAYNNHNGYYGHAVKVTSHQLVLETTI